MDRSRPSSPSGGSPADAIDVPSRNHDNSSMRMDSYLTDPVLREMYAAIRAQGALKAISLDITSKCNLRCSGCYYYAEGMDQVAVDRDDTRFDELLRSERERGTNFVTVVGGEPALALGRLKKLHDNFRINVATNGLIPIPLDGFETMPIGVAVWGDHGTDARLRGDGSKDLFATALANYRDDPRAFWYYTVAPGCAEEIESVVEQCVDNGNRVLFNYYSDVARLGGELDYRHGFEAVRREIDRMIARFPDRVFTTRYLNEVVTTGQLCGESWGYSVCTNLSVDSPVNAKRLENGNPFNRHFRAVNADFSTTRRCCTGISRDCASCFDTWEHFSWIMINMRKHLREPSLFAGWLATTFVFYLVNRMIDFEHGSRLLADFQRRGSETRSGAAKAPEIQHATAGIAS